MSNQKFVARGKLCVHEPWQQFARKFIILSNASDKCKVANAILTVTSFNLIVTSVGNLTIFTQLDTESDESYLFKTLLQFIYEHYQIMFNETLIVIIYLG